MRRLKLVAGFVGFQLAFRLMPKLIRSAFGLTFSLPKLVSIFADLSIGDVRMIPSI